MASGNLYPPKRGRIVVYAKLAMKDDGLASIQWSGAVGGMHPVGFRPDFLPPACNVPPPRLSIVAPCYDECACLPEFHRQASDAAHKVVGENYEIILVNDDSKDATPSVMRVLAASDRHALAINLSRNFGHQKALSAGLHFSRGECVLAIDADLQDPPSVLPKMMARMDEGYDAVYGWRSGRDGETLFKTTSAALFYSAAAPSDRNRHLGGRW